MRYTIHVQYIIFMLYTLYFDRCNAQHLMFTYCTQCTLLVKCAALDVHFLYTMLSPKLHKAAHRVTIRSIGAKSTPSASSFSVFTIFNGRVSWRILYRFLRSPITRSTWMRMFAMSRVPSTSAGDNCGLPLVNAGMISSAEQMTAKSSCKVKPQCPQGSGLRDGAV